MSEGFTALVVDDEAHMRSFIKLILVGLGARKVYLVKDGTEAIDAYREYDPDVVMLDINMDKMNGMRALDEIKEINPNAAVVMMTSVATRGSIEDAWKRGATHYVLKTMDPDEIESRIGSVLRKVMEKPQGSS